MGAKSKILLVDDEEGFTDIVKINLEMEGVYEVAVVNNPVHAIEVALEFQPDLVVLDIVMPEMDGGDILAEMRRNESLKDTPVIMLTALVSNAETAGEAAVQSRGEVMLAKPVSASKLFETIEAKLAGII